MDSFDHRALIGELLRPFAAGAPRVPTGLFDGRSDSHVSSEQEAAPTSALIFDGVFLLRPELRDFWDLSIYLHVPEFVSLARAAARDAGLFGSADQVRLRYERRYLPGQALYRQAVDPVACADVVIDNSDPLNPIVIRYGHEA